MFSIAIENSRNGCYFTEKILDCFTTRTVPIYWGCPDIGDYFDMNVIITFNRKSYCSWNLSGSQMSIIFSVSALVP